ncbi:1-(5-phosphoribosyl)-5-[(5-phosphoribosylamino)methylideneamino]imidazole-4-carboxamide isomerase [Pseudoroseomonas deserti]|uniref:1-(5-phosphoribosyl)-5-[(5-phosphoribosylamino)methylideneamino] imidazole-4-carboxamide isomerase n=1 Tax=Teichococcus deserti TaxID=1817963 RepID=A0A1V2GXF1_9PROT|nr:1-(5-phosphoribosyl)-5-[(5-phosphoribosylamino)methylideneamino]imidazole-4-carboxamide isomerase [Pseudoroseomonas deserti]ONG49321.1 1-(5-phosphoribosyl)-5-[(5-phosphoribosylamino)methylideneamino]imidazole-4-carboxamide isomerase [Pseudoroseomonas deserti]
MSLFQLYPAIDLKAGKVVRLKRGDMDQATIYAEDPGAQAAAFDEAGFDWLHVVDLDGAFAGRPANAEAVAAILKGTRRPVQLGGGIRDMATVEAWLSRGVARVILGSAAVKDPEFARAACKAFPGKVAVGIDAKDGMVATEGWAEVSSVSALDLALSFEDAGAAAIIHTDIDRDGMLGGVNVAATAEIAARLATPVIASGGVAGVQDIVALKAAGHVAGTIIGRALYDGRLTAAEAMAAARA